MTEGMLPDAFSDLEGMAADGWCLATERERYVKRLDSEMPALLEVYAAAFPRFREILDYLDQFPIDDLPEKEQNLLFLLYSLIQISLAVDMWGQPQVIDAGNAVYFRTVEPIP